MITYDQFKQLDIRTAKIVSVEEHPNADRLYVLKVDIGGEERTSVAGIRPWYKPEELVGRNIVFLTNLEPAKVVRTCRSGWEARQPQKEEKTRTYRRP